MPKRKKRQTSRTRCVNAFGHSCILVMLSGFLLVVLLMAGWWLWTVYGLVGMRTFFRATPGTIISSRVVRHEDSDDGERYEVRLKYTYDVDGRRYEGYRYNVSFGGGFHDEVAAEEVVASLPPGKRVTVYYDPSFPSQSALTDDLYDASPSVRGGGSGLTVQSRGQGGLLVVIPAFFLLGAGIIWYQRRKARRLGRTPDTRPLKQRFREWMTGPVWPEGSVKPPAKFVLPLGAVFAGAGLWIMTTAFAPRELSQIQMGTAGQLLFGLIFVLIGGGCFGLGIVRTLDR